MSEIKKQQFRMFILFVLLLALLFLISSCSEKECEFTSDCPINEICKPYSTSPDGVCARMFPPAPGPLINGSWVQFCVCENDLNVHSGDLEENWECASGYSRVIRCLTLCRDRKRDKAYGKVCVTPEEWELK